MNQKKNQKNKNPNGGMKFKKKTFMTNDKLKQIIFILVVIVVLLFTTLAVVVSNHRTSKQPVPQPQIIVITDTISKVVYDTVYIKEYKTVKLPTTDTLYRDSLRIDSVFVEVPISVFQLDTTFCTDSTRLDLHIINSGFDVKLDTLYYRLEYKPTTIKLPKKRHRFGFYIGPSVGISYDWTTGKTLPSVGIGVGIGFSFGKY